MIFRQLVVAVGVAGLMAASELPAQTSRDLAERHPAAQTVVQYLRSLLMRDYAKAAGMVAATSLEGFKGDYMRRLKSPNVPLDDVLAMCRALGVQDEAHIEEMTPVRFYVAYNEGMQKRYQVTDEVNRRISDTLELHLLSVAEERPDLVHFLVRTRHATMKNFIQNLEIISLVKERGAWKVSLGENLTKVSSLDSPEAKPIKPPPLPPVLSPPPSDAIPKPADPKPANPKPEDSKRDDTKPSGEKAGAERPEKPPGPDSGARPAEPRAKK